MGDRSSWGYSRSYGSGSSGKPHYSSSHESSSTYTRSGERDRSRDFEYTRSSSSSHHNQDQRDFYHRDDYENFNKGSNYSHNRGSHRRDAYENSSYTRHTRDNDARSHSSRFYEHTPGSQKPHEDLTPSWDIGPVLGRNRSRSPSAYINRSPPHPTPAEKPIYSKSRKSPSPTRVHPHTTPRWPDDKSSVPFAPPSSSWQPEPSVLPFDRRPKEPLEAPMNSGSGKLGIEVVKLKERLKEYVPWLTSRKTCIFDCRRDKDLKDQVDDIDWCLDVIQDIKSNESIGMQTLSRAQDMVMRLISRGPVTSNTFNESDARVESTLRDDIYSARSPSPPNFVDGIQFSRRSQMADSNSNPRVIPTDRNEFLTTNHSTSRGIPVDQNQAASFQINPLSRPGDFLYNQPNQNDAYSSIPRAIPADRTDFSVGTSSTHSTPAVDKTIYDYDHGQPADEALFERRKPTVTETPKVVDEKTKALEEQRRLKQWEESSDEDEILIIRKGKNQPEQRVYVAEPRPGRSKTHRSSEEIRSPEPEDFSEFNRFGKDMTNPMNPASLQPRSHAPVPPVGLQQTVLLQNQQNPATLLQAQGQAVPLHLMNMNRPLFNPFLNTLGNLSGMTPSQMLLKTQAQMLMGFTQVPASGANLLPIPNQNIAANMTPGFGFRNPNPRVHGSVNDVIVPQVSQDTDRQTQEEIMMSRIKARAAESFSHRTKNPRPGGIGGNSENTSHAQSTGDSSLNPEQSALPSMGPSAHVLDPRLKPRQPRDFVSRDFRRANYEDGNQHARKDFSDDNNFRRPSTERPNEGRQNHEWNTTNSRTNSGSRQNDNRFHNTSDENYGNGRYSRSSCAGDSDIENKDRYESARDDGNSEDRVKRTFIVPPIDRSRKFQEDRGRRFSGDQQKIRRGSGDLAVEENVERVSRNFRKSDHRYDFHRSSSPRLAENSDKTERGHREDEDEDNSDDGSPTSKFPSLFARVQTVSGKFTPGRIDSQATSHHSRLEEIRREAEVLHPIGSSSKVKAPEDEKVTENGKGTSGRKGKKRNASPRDGTTSKTVTSGQKRADSNSQEEEESTPGLRRSTRKKISPVKAPVVKSPKSKGSQKRSPVRAVKKTSDVFRIPKLKKSTPEETVAESTERVADLSDSYHELRIDMAESPSGIENTDDINEESNQCGGQGRRDTTQRQDRSPSPRKTSSDLQKPSTSVDIAKSTLPAGTDELIKSLLFSTLSAEEAEVLSSSEDYLASTLARFKEELSAKVKERARPMSGESAESSVSSTTPFDKAVETTPESKDEQDKADESSRSRSVSRKKPQTKRRSSLEKLHDALREMNFDSMMPLGPRRNLTRMANEEHQFSQESNEHGKSAEGGKTSVPKLSPVVVLTNVTKSPSQANILSPSLTSESPPLEEPIAKKRKYTRRKEKEMTQELNQTSANIDGTAEDATLPKKKQKVGEKESDPAQKSMMSDAVIIGPSDLIVDTNLSKIKLEFDYNPVTSGPDTVDDNTRTGGAGFEDMEMVDLGKDLQLKPADFGLTEDDNLLFKVEDFQLSLSDEDDLSTMEPEDFDINPEDFVIKVDGLGLDTIKNLKIPTTVEGDAAGNAGSVVGTQANRDRPGRQKKKMARGVSGIIHCPLCTFSGRKIVDHYVNTHSGVTIPQACLSEGAFKLLQENNKSDSPQLMEIRYSPLHPIRCSFCRIPISNLGAYCQHLTCHTGEFRFQCSVCNIKFPAKALATAHCKMHKKDNIEISDCLTETSLPMEVLENSFYAYLCGECNYFQINSESIRLHLDLTKHSDTDIVCIKFKGSTVQDKDLPLTGSTTLPTSVAGCSLSLPLPQDSRTLSQPLKSVFVSLDVEPGGMDTPPLHSSEFKRYKPTNISRLAYISARFAKLGTEIDEGEPELTPFTNLESESERLSGASETVNRLLDIFCCEEDIVAEMQNLPIMNKQRSKEEQHPTVEDLYQSMGSLEEMSDMSDMDADEYSDSDSCDLDEVEDEDEPNDFYDESQTDEHDEDAAESTEKDLTSIEDHSEAEFPELSPTPEAGEVSCKSPSSPPPSSPRFLDSDLPSMVSSVLNPTDEDIDGVKDLEGTDLYRCGNKECEFQGRTLLQFKEHSTSCKLGVASRAGVPCFHCEKAFKTPKVFLEHVEGHGKCKLCCALCSFKARMASVMKRHFKSVHKVAAAKGYKCINLPAPCDSLWFPKDIYNKRIEVQLIQENPLLYVPRIQFLPDEVEDIPKPSIMSAEIHCAICSYSTKVRQNMIRHLNLHKNADENGSAEVPAEAPVNPVPWIERKELMFDKMTNWAGSTHTAKAEVAASEREKLPQFVLDQFRYVCSVPSCAHITVDDSLLRSHMRALHSEFENYECPHCQLRESTRINPQFTVPIDKIGIHLKLHGPKLLKCGHCDFISIQTKQMEKHVAEKHVEKKPIHYVIRDVDGETGASRGRRGSVEDGGIVKSSERWKCGICRVILSTWEDVRDHCQRVHCIKSQFMCDSCPFSTNSIYQVTNHITAKICVSQDGEYPFVLTYFSRGELGEEKVRYPIWRRASAREHLRGIFFLHEHEHEAETANSSKPTPATKGLAPVPKPQTVVVLKPPPTTVLKPSTGAVITSTKGKGLVGTNKRKVKRGGPAHESPPLYVCSQCGTFKTRLADLMRTHLRQHFGYHRFTCKLCEHRFWTMTSFKFHIEEHHKETYSAIKHLRTEPQNPEIEGKLEKCMLECMPDPLGPEPEPEVQILPSRSKSPSKSGTDGVVFYEEVTIID